MPELPEVEEVRRTLEPFVLGRTIARIDLLRRDFIEPPTAPLSRLCGHAIARTWRHGKKLFLVADDGQTLVLHLGMSGRVDCVPAAAPVLKHTHVIFHLDGGSQVRLRDPRRFGGLWYYPAFDLATAQQCANLGPDALALRLEDLAHWKNSRGRLKQRLLSQQDVAGLGNIYVDEALFMAHLHPRQRVARITPDQLRRLVEAILLVLNRSIQSGGTTLRDYRNVSDQPGAFAQQLQCYGRGKMPCLRCGKTLRTCIVASRTTTFCPACQRCRP